MTSTDLDGVLRATLSSPLTAGQGASLDRRLRARLEQRSSRRFQVRPRTLVLLVAVLLLAAPVVFVASAALRTTESPNGLSSAAAFQAEIDAAKAVVPLPPGATWPASLAATDKSAGYSTGGGRTWVEFVAFCAWDRAWLDATSSGARPAAQQAEDVIVAAPTWQFYRGIFATQSVRDVIDRVIAGVKAGDPAPGQEFFVKNCGG